MPRSGNSAKGSSDRAFGFVFAGFFLLVAVAPIATAVLP